MRNTALLVAAALFLAGTFAVQAQVGSHAPPTWETGDSWEYRTRVAFDPRRTSIANFTSHVTRSSIAGGLPVDFVLHGSRTYTYPPEILLVEWDSDAVRWFVAAYDRLSVLSWWEVVLVEEDGRKRIAVDREGPLLASIEGWRLFDWPLRTGKRWSGVSTVLVNDVLIRTDYEAHVFELSTVRVPAGAFEASEVKYNGRISRQGRIMPFEQSVWFSPVAKNVIRLVLSAAGRNVELELMRHWRREQ